MWSHSKMKSTSTSQWAIPQVKLMATKNDKHGRRRQEDESWWPQLRWWSKFALRQIWIKPYEEWRKIKDAQVLINLTYTEFTWRCRLENLKVIINSRCQRTCDLWKNHSKKLIYCRFEVPFTFKVNVVPRFIFITFHSRSMGLRFGLYGGR